MTTFPYGGAAQVFRDFLEDGNPVSDDFEPRKSQIRALLGLYELLLNTLEAATGDPEAIAEILAAFADKADKSITVTGSGRLAGQGGSLASNRTFSLPLPTITDFVNATAGVLADLRDVRNLAEMLRAARGGLNVTDSAGGVQVVVSRDGGVAMGVDYRGKYEGDLGLEERLPQDIARQTVVSDRYIVWEDSRDLGIVYGYDTWTKTLIDRRGEAERQRVRDFYAVDTDGSLKVYQATFSKIVPERSFNIYGWPQGKLCALPSGRLLLGYNRTTTHGGSDALAFTTYSDDRGETWSTPVAIVTGESNARGTDCFALGCDGDGNPWAIVRSRGANNNIGTTTHKVYKSTDSGATWTLSLDLDGTTYGVAQGGQVPELYHSFAFQGGKMLSFYHFANSSRAGVISFDPADPAGTLASVDVVADNAFSGNAVVLVEGALFADTVEGDGETWLMGGLRTQNASLSDSKFFKIKADLTGFVSWTAPETVAYSPVTVVRIGSLVYAMTIERNVSGQVNLWVGTAADFYAGVNTSFYRVDMGAIVKTPTSPGSTTEVGVQAMAVFDEWLYIAFTVREGDAARAFPIFAAINVGHPGALLSNDLLNGM